MFGKKRIERQNLAIEESAKIIVSNLIYGQTPTESMLAETYSANLKKHGLSATRYFDLIELLNGTILHIHNSCFLTTEQKTRFRASLGDLINELRNPYGKIDYELNEILEKTGKVKERLGDEQADKTSIIPLVTTIEEGLKKIRLNQARPRQDNYVLKALVNLMCFSGKVVVYGITFNALAILSFLLYLYLKDPNALSHFLKT